MRVRPCLMNDYIDIVRITKRNIRGSITDRQRFERGLLLYHIKVLYITAFHIEMRRQSRADYSKVNTIK